MANTPAICASSLPICFQTCLPWSTELKSQRWGFCPSPQLQVTLQQNCMCIKARWASVTFSITFIRIYSISKPLSATENIMYHFLYLKLWNHVLSGLHVNCENPNGQLQTVFFLEMLQHFIMILASVSEVFWMLPLGNSGLLLMLQRKQVRGFSSSLSLEIREAGNL